jgi:hypothetical protein
MTKKPDNRSWLPDHEIESLARCLLPAIVAFYENEDGAKEFEEWKRKREEMTD